MYRFIVRSIIFLLAIVVSLYVGVQWKLKEDLKYLSSRLAPEIQFDYQSSVLTPSGKIVVSDIDLNIRALDLNITIDKVEYSAGSIWDMAFLKGQIDDKQLPKQLSLSVKELIIPLSPSLIDTISLAEQSSTWDTLSASGCGDVKQFGINEYSNMGYDYIVFSSDAEFYQDDYSGNLIGKGWIDIEETSKFTYQLDLSGVYEAGEDADNKDNTPILEKLNLDIQDKGYNRHRNEFCALKSGLSADEYIEKHIKTFVKTLKSVDIEMTLASQRVYKDSMQPLSQISLSMKPKPSFSFKDFGYYNEAELRELLGFKISVNDQNIDSIFNKWSLDKFNTIVIASDDDEQSEGLQRRYENVIVKRKFQKEPASSAEKFIDYKVKIIRDDGKVYQGRLKEIKKNKLYIAMPVAKGTLKLSVEKKRVKEFYVHQ